MNDHVRFSKTGEGFAMLLHDMSMSKDPTTACAGRLLKDANGIITNWFEAEDDRGTDFGDVAQSYPVIIANIAGMLVSHICSYDAGKQVILLRSLSGAVQGAMSMLADKMSEEVKSRAAKETG